MSTTDPRTELKESDIEGFFLSASEFVKESRALILERFYNGFEVSLKEDQSLVTEADTEAEALLRDLIGKKFPEHGIIGEEQEAIKSESEFQWIIDPIDGTQNFAHGIPTFGTLLALQFREHPIIGVIDHPALQQCYIAGYRRGAFCNNQAIQIQDKPEKTIHPLEIVCIANRSNFAKSGDTHLYDAFTRSHPSVRSYHDCFGHSRAIHGQASAMVESNVRIWDIAPAQVLCEEAGGRYVSLGTWPDQAGKKYYSAIFGKKSVVEFLEGLFRR